MCLDPRLSTKAKTIAYALATHANGRGSKASLNSLQLWTGLARSTVCKGLDELIEAEWVTRTHQRTRGGRAATNLYSLITPDLDQPDTTEHTQQDDYQPTPNPAVATHINDMCNQFGHM